MKKKIVSAILLLTMTSSVCMTAVAEESPFATKKDFQSHGAIQYSQGGDSVVIDSDDIYTLADQLDQFKARTIKQLGEMGTYLTRTGGDTALTSARGVYVVHKEPGEGEEVDPLSLNFTSILVSVAASQSITTDPAAYVEDPPDVFYKTREGRLTTTYSENAEAITIQAADEDNLSAGTAAWVNGELLLGTGADVADAYGEDGPLEQHEISSTYTIPKELRTAFVYLGTSGSGSSIAAPDPVLELQGGGTCEKLYEHSYSRNSYNVKVALYRLSYVPQGAKVKGSGGMLFY